MPQKKYLVTLTPEEREHLARPTSAGQASALVLTRARVLLKADQADGGPARDDARIAAALDVGHRTVERVLQRFVERCLEAALRRKPGDRPSRARKLGGAAEARLIALASSAPPGERVAWTPQLLADRLAELRVVGSVSDEAVRRVLQKTRSSRGSRSSGASRRTRARRS